jgi:SAM-dependent methyltransferase
MGEWHAVFKTDLNWFGRRLKQQQFRVLDKLAGRYNVSSAIEIGCGSGWLMRHMLELGVKTIGIDNEPLVIQKLTAAGLTVKQMDARHLDFPDSAFDLAYSDGVIEHFPDPAPVVREMVRVSRKYVLTMIPYHHSPFGWLMRGWHWLRHFPREFIRRRESWIDLHLKHGLRLVEEGTLNWGEELWFLFEKTA